MGCGGSKEFNTVYTDYPKLKLHQEAFEKIGLTEKEVGLFYERFLQYKIDVENNCLVKEIVFKMHCECGEFMTRYWTSVAKNSTNNDTVNFPEFVFGFWNLLTLRPLQKTYDQFTFDLYCDRSGRNKGNMTSNSAKSLLDHIYGSKKNFLYKKAIKSLLDPKTPSTFTLADWNEFTITNEGILSPLQDFQKKERFKLLGHSFWEKKMNARKKFSRGKSYLNLDETLSANNISTTTPSSGLTESMRKTPAPSLSKKSASQASIKRGRSSSQRTLLQGGSCNSISVDG